MAVQGRGRDRVKAPARGPSCPICGKPVVQDFKPFCSKRCADIDLGRWLGGRYAVPGEPVGADTLDEDQGEQD